MSGQAGFFDLEKRSAALSQAGDPFERMNAVMTLHPLRDLARPRRTQHGRAV